MNKYDKYDKEGSMPDLYSTFLKNTAQIQFGATPFDIVALKEKRGEVMGTKKLIVVYDKLEYNPIDCQSVTMEFEGDTIRLNVTLAKGEESQLPADQLANVPQAKAIIPAAKTDMFMLQGDDLEAFELLSSFHSAENRRQKTENDKLQAHTLASAVFDIQDLTSIRNAILDIVEKEKQYIDQGYKVFKTNVPRFDYENDNDFKLVESVVLMPPVDAPVKVGKEDK